MLLPIHFGAYQIVDMFKRMIPHTHIAQMLKRVGNIVKIGTGISCAEITIAAASSALSEPAYWICRRSAT